MARVYQRPSGGWELQFTINRIRKSVYLGMISDGDAQGHKRRVAEIESAKKHDQPYSEGTIKWIGSLSDKLHAQFADKGLFAPRVATKAPENRLSVLLAAWRSKKLEEGAKPSTIRRIDQVSKDLRTFFRKDPLITEIDSDMARAWRDWMRENGKQKSKSGKLAPNTVNRLTGNAKEAFNVAIAKRWISENPFSGLESTVWPNEKRKEYVSLVQADEVLKCLPDIQWRLVFGLARFAGLRCPSEVKALRWSDVDLNADPRRRLLQVTSVKTERYEGHSRREVPIVGSLYALLKEAESLRDSKEDGPVLTRADASEAVYRRGLLRYLKKAGIKPWNKLFQNLRVSFENDLISKGYAFDTVARIMGHSPKVALMHYLMRREKEYAEIAINGLGAGGVESVLQNVLHSEAVSSDSGVVTENADSEENQGNDATCESVIASDDSQENVKSGRCWTRIVIKSTAFHGVSPVDSANCSALPTQHPLKELLELAERLSPSQQQRLLTYARSLTRSAPITETAKRISIGTIAGFLTEVAQ